MDTITTDMPEVASTTSFAPVASFAVIISVVADAAPAVSITITLPAAVTIAPDVSLLPRASCHS